MARNVLVLIIAGIGDFLEAVPALAALRKACPSERITIAVSDRALEYARNCPYADQVISFGAQGGSVSAAKAFSRFGEVLKLRKQRFDVLINFKEVDSWPGSLKLLTLALCTAPQMTIGRNTDGRGWFFTKKVEENTKFLRNNQAWYFNRLAELYSNVPVDDSKKIPSLWSSPGDCEKLDNILTMEGIGLEEQILIVNPGSDRPTRRWNNEAFAATASHFHKNFGLRPIVIGGPGETALSASVRAAIKGPAASLAGKLTVSQLIMLVARARLVLTTNSAVLHIAGLAGVPVVSIAGSGNPRLDFPSGDPKKIKLIWKDVSCNPCYNYVCPDKGSNRCMNIITVDEVILAGEQLLHENN